MKDIKYHPWYLCNLPLYLKENQLLFYKNVKEVDEELVKKLFTVNVFNFPNYPYLDEY